MRPAALDACAGYEHDRAVPILAGVLHGAAEPVNLRQHAAAALARINSDASREQLLRCLQTAPESLALAIAAGLADIAAGARSPVGGGDRG